jgi:predicted dithiol-disulfide oxidoreductase (DUF899 family)
MTVMATRTKTHVKSGAIGKSSTPRKPTPKTRAASVPKAPKKLVRKPTKRVDVLARIQTLERKIRADKRHLATLRKAAPHPEVPDYVFKAHDGTEIRLSEMFGAHKDLILVHNMGRGCRYCTLWADGFTGLTKHLENRAAFVVVSKDRVDMQREFYRGRGWNFRMYSSHESTFNRDMGFETEKGGQMPGVSAFRKDESGKIHRTGYTLFGPGDDFCALWPMLDLLADGPNNWEPQYQY